MAKKNITKETLEHVRQLFEQADSVFPDKKANELVRKARKIAMKKRMSLPSSLKRRFCKHCYAYLKPGRNARVRIHKGKIIIFCAECKKFTRIPTRKSY